MYYIHLLAAVPLIAANLSSVTSMRWERRVLLVSAPTAQDTGLAAQRRIVAGWKAGAEARDLSIVEITGQRVAGATDTAAALRRKFRLSENSFAVILIGKDGGEKLRSARPFSAAVLEKTIDAMPMRRNGQR